MATNPEVLLLGAVALHAGFQLTVTAVVYPALFRAQDWDSAHTAHTRAITPVVAVVYAALVGACVWVEVDGIAGPATVVALAGVALSLLVTAVVAGPTHGRLAQGRDRRLLRRLQTADLVRNAGALMALAGALFAVL